MDSQVHHKDVPDSLAGDAQAHEFLLGCLGRAAYRARDVALPAFVEWDENSSALPDTGSPFINFSLSERKMVPDVSSRALEEAEAGARAIEHFPRSLLQEIPTLVDVISSALGAIVSAPLLPVLLLLFLI